jgi:hypothetical protein
MFLDEIEGIGRAHLGERIENEISGRNQHIWAIGEGFERGEIGRLPPPKERPSSRS